MNRKINEHLDSSNVNGWQDLSATLGALRTNPSLYWANPLEVKTAVESIFTERFGTKESAKPVKASKGAKNPKVSLFITAKNVSHTITGDQGEDLYRPS
jgi:glutaminyl-tRNA synthetase